ncbi:MAG: peptide chain release factor N(5)-glutamine methyltransferase [Bacteroidetes bacterium]|nr:peptide chain release factor N(5)-glutamine methyltransferase [Bacteroidota bacterium]
MKVSEFKTMIITSLASIYEEGEAIAVANSYLATKFDKALNQIQELRHIELEDDQYQQFTSDLNKLASGIPLQYVVNEAWFYDLKLFVNDKVLIPRPETEELVSLGLYDYEKTQNPLRILDIGTGSGCIPVLLGTKFPVAEIFASDISEEALEIAKLNSRNHQTNVSFLLDDILNTKLTFTHQLQVIISNPPYIAASESVEMQSNVTEYEPEIALFVPDSDPFIFYKAIAANAARWLQPGGKLYLEINQRFGRETEAIIRDAGFTNVKVIKDMSQNNRFIVAMR